MPGSKLWHNIAPHILQGPQQNTWQIWPWYVLTDQYISVSLSGSFWKVREKTPGMLCCTVIWVFHKIKNAVKSIMAGVMGPWGKCLPCEETYFCSKVRVMVVCDLSKAICGQLTSYCMAGYGLQPSAIIQVACSYTLPCTIFALHCTNCGCRKITTIYNNTLWSETRLIGWR